MQSEKTEVILGLGTNLGHKTENLFKAIEMLEHRNISIIKRSKVYKTPPWGFESEEDFYNMALNAETILTPMQLLIEIKSIEMLMGRPVQKQNKEYVSRIIDIDIIDYNGQVVDFNDLKIPHPLLANRAFVIFPLRDVAADYSHPITGATIEELMDSISNETITVVNI